MVPRFERRLCRPNLYLGGGREQPAASRATTVGRAAPLAQAREVLEDVGQSRLPQRGGAAWRRRQAEVEVLAHGEAGEDAPVLRHEADAEARDVVGRQPREVAALELDGAAPRLE